MAGTTTHGLPFPTGGDRVMDGDNAMQALAEAVDTKTLGDSGWVTLALDGTVFQAVAGYTLAYRKVNNRVTVHGAFKWASGAFLAATITTLPVGARPGSGQAEWLCLAVGNPSKSAAQLLVFASGIVQCPGTGYAVGTPVVGDTFYVYGSFLI